MSFPTELYPDQSRQATHVFRGYAYQAYHTIIAWLRVSPDEELLVEFAEDIDLVRRDLDGNVRYAELTQVKNEKGSVTLNNQSVCDLINHFVDHRLRNAGMKLSAHLCTISDRGVEKEVRWVYADRGLNLWDMLRERMLSDPDFDKACSILRDFLRGNTKLSKETQTVLASYNSELFLTDFVDLIFWDTGQQSYAEIQKEIELILAARARPITDPMEVEQVINRLWRYVTSAMASDLNKTLLYRDLEELLARETSVSVDRKVITDMRSGMLRIEHSMSKVQSDVQVLVAKAISPVLPDGCLAILQQKTFGTQLPPLPEVCSSRAKVLDDLTSVGEGKSVVWIWGSTGYGKSVLANLLIRRSEDAAIWFNLRGYSDFNLTSALLSLIDHFQASDGCGHFVALDDLGIEKQNSYCVDLLRSLAYLLRDKKSTMVITSQSKPPTRFAMGTKNDLVVFDAPSMTLSEITSLIETVAPLDSQSQTFWSNYVWSMSQGHPQLVSAYVSWASGEQWVIPANDLFQRPASVEEVVIEARRLLSDAIPFDESRELARRLSIVMGYFTRDFALDLGLSKPSLTEPGRAFDTLVGPWIETCENGIYSLSPLLSDYAKSEVGATDLIFYQRILGYAFLKQTSLTPLQIVQAISVALFVKLQPLLAKACFALMSLNDKVFAAISGDLFLLSLLYAGDQAQLFSGIDPRLKFMFRTIQLKIARFNKDQETYSKIDSLILREFEGVEADRELTLFYYIETIIHFDNPISIGERIRRAIEVLRIQKQDRQITNDLDELINALPTKGIFVLACSAIHTQEELRVFLEMLLVQTGEIVSLVLQDFEMDIESISLLIDRVWLHESNLPNPNWVQCDQLFSAIASFAADQGHTWLFVSASRGRMVIHDEYLGDPRAALRIASEASGKLGKTHPLFILQQSTVYYRMENYGEALSRILHLENSLPDNALTVERLFALSRGLRCAEKLEAWNDLIFCAKRGQLISRAAFQPMSAVANIAFRAEEGWAMHQTGKIIPAAHLFKTVLEEMQAYPEQQDPFFHALKLRFGLMLTWLAVSSDDKSKKPFAGMLANFEKPPVESKDLAAASYPLTWSLLGKYIEWSSEYDLILSTTSHAMTVVESKQGYLALLTAREVLFAASLVAEDYAEALSNGFEYCKLFVKISVFREMEGQKWAADHTLDFEVVLNEQMNKVHEKWSDNAIYFVFEPLVMAICSSLRPAKLDTSGLTDIVQRTIGVSSESSEALKWVEITANALLGCESAKTMIMDYISDYTSLPPVIQRFPIIVGSGMLDLWPARVLSCQGSLLKHAAASHPSVWSKMFCRMVANYWRRFATERPFALINPRLSVPSIKEQASKQVPTPKDCARLLLLASEAIGLPFPPAMLSDIRIAAG